MSVIKPYNPKELEEINTSSGEFKNRFLNSNIVICGATGFVGSWITSSIDHMNRYHGTNISVSAISRRLQPEFISTYPTIKFIPLDVSAQKICNLKRPSLVINAATPSSPSHGGGDPRQVLDAATLGTSNLIEFCSKSPEVVFINLSSGIVTKRKDDILTDLSNVKDAYLEGKRRSEELVTQATSQGLIEGKNLRLYAFAGPGISLVDHFAVGNFMLDAIQTRPILIKGNPESRRSYLYPTDLITNILAAAASPSTKNMELGSTHHLTIRELSQLINSLLDNTNSGVNQISEFGEVDEYFPTVSNLAVTQKITLDAAVVRWAEWLKEN